METDSVILCPVYPLPLPTPCDSDELTPLLEHLRENRAISETVQFPRGTVMADTRLDLCKQSIGAAGCRLVTQALIENATITSLLLGTNGIGDTGAVDVANLVIQSRQLDTIYLGCNHIGESGVAALADALIENRTITGLWLKRNPIGTAGARHLARMLRHNRTLRTLDLVNCQIGGEGRAFLLDALIEDNRSVAHLYLGGNSLYPQDAEPLTALIQSNPAIRSLLLNVNRLGDEGAKILANGLRHNSTLTAIGLASNGITFAGLTELLDTIERHPAMAHLDLGYSPSTQKLSAVANSVGDAGAARIDELLSQNFPLVSLSLNGNGITEQGREHLIRGLEQNRYLCRLNLGGTPDERIEALLRRNRECVPKDNQFHDPDCWKIQSVYRTA